MTEHGALTSEWVQVCPADQLPAGGRAAVDMPSGERCLVVHVNGAYHAVSATCTHKALSLEGGTLRGGSIVCPWHRARFDLATGRASLPARKPLKTFEVAVVNGTVCVREKEGNL
jgi:3-phenylpropionate/trans-cinnamate dioxygenase ferredoxin subunit